MAGPPDNIDPSDLWLALTQIPRPHKLVDLPRCFPGTSTSVGQVAMWPISQEEQVLVNVEADRYTKKVLQDPQKKDEANLGYQHTFANEVAVQILYRVCRDANNLERAAFPSPTQMRQQFTADEIGVMFAEYLTVQLELGPIVAEMTEEEMNGWIRRLASGGSAYPFSLLSSEMQSRLVLSMAFRLANFLTDTTSVGLPHESPQPSETSVEP